VKRGRLVIVGLLALAAAGLVFVWSLMGSATVSQETSFTIPAGSSVSAVADKLEAEGRFRRANFCLSRG